MVHECPAQTCGRNIASTSRACGNARILAHSVRLKNLKDTSPALRTLDPYTHFFEYARGQALPKCIDLFPRVLFQPIPPCCELGDSIQRRSLRLEFTPMHGHG